MEHIVLLPIYLEDLFDQYINPEGTASTVTCLQQ